MLAPGHSIDRYVVESILGTGGTAVVYRVRHRALNTLHALKVLSVTSTTIRERMIREGQVQAALKHLNVVAVTDVLDIEGAPGLLLEYIEGPSLEDALRRYRLNLPDAEILFQGILSGVKHAHAFGLVHRDLKPANVLLARTPDGFVPKVTDFGLAKVLQEGDGTATTRNGIAMGTPHYMAPEQIRDARNVDQRADLFSLGCLLYELCTGDRTFPGDEALAIYNAIIGGEYVPARTLVPSLPDRFDIAIRGCLATDPNRRIPDCTTLADVLRGDRTWDVDATPMPVQPRTANAAPAPAHEPNRSSIPIDTLPVAARADDGSTPPPAPSREERPPSPMPFAATSLGMETATTTEENHPPLDSSEVSLSRARPQSPTEATLGADKGPETSTMGASLWVLFATSIALVAGLIAISAVIAVAAVFVVQASTPPSRTTTDPNPIATPAPPPKPVPPPIIAEPVSVDPAAPTPTIEATPAPRVAPKPTEPKATEPRSKPVEVVRAPLVPAVAEAVTVKILSTPPTARVKIDGKAVPGATPLKVGLPPGSHAVEITSGDDTHAFPIVVAGTGDNRWCFTFEDNAVHDGSCPP